jgi:oligoribonuclease NrnB/cAMP/cGMP phosphodiesterase (DHH superfamily)
MVQSQTTLEGAKLVLESGKALVKALRSGDTESLDQLEAYTAQFDQWQRSWAKGDVKLTAREAEFGRRIAEQHALVIELATELKRSVENSLKSLRGWNRGLKAYIDHFPKQLGTIRPRKG